jgi:fatty-acyl-CoA synthase
MRTVTDLLLARADDDHPGLRFQERTWSWAEHVRESARYAAALRRLRRSGPFHVGVLADNLPEFSFLLGACALSGAVLVGLNPTRRGAALARDVEHADCQFVLTEPRYRDVVPDAVLFSDLDLPDAGVDPVEATPDDLLMLIFTSGTSGEPKAVRCTHAKVTVPGEMLSGRFGLGPADTVYLSMPMFHSNAIMAGWAVGLAAGATLALRDRFSASGFLPDVRRFGATYANYVGRPLSYVLATPPRPDDADNPLRIVYGNEGAEADIAEFGRRFGVRVIDGFGSTEGGIAVARTPDTPPGALGRLTDELAIVDEAGNRCPVADFDSTGRLRNADAIGELVNTSGAGWFAGYYNDPGATDERLRGGWYHSGDLAYADVDGFCYFAGRSGDWLRVDGENLGTAPIERVLLRHPDLAEVAVYAVPDTHIGDQVMAAVVARDGRRPDLAGFHRFLAGQADLGPKQWSRFVRVAGGLPKTATYKVLKRVLVGERWNCEEPVWWRPPGHGEFMPLNNGQVAALEAGLAR